MSFKLIVVCATLAAVSCARLDNEQLNRQVQQEMILQQNDQIRDHQRVENQQRQVQLRELEDQRRRQEQIIRSHDQQRRDNVRSIFLAPNQFLPTSYQIVSIPSSSRNFEYLDNSNYNFDYAVRDLTSGDMKSQSEVRRGDQVQGQYTMMDSDGYQRIVDYRADDENGFDASVRREPTAAALVTPQVIRIEGNNNYAPHFYHQRQHGAHFIAQPTIYATTSVSRREDGKQNHYTSTTASNF